MKPKKKSSVFDSLKERFPPTPLYRADLEEIISIGKSRDLEMTISDDTAEFDDLDDVQENRGDRVKHLEISFRSSPYSSIKLRITPMGISLTTSKVDELLATWHEMKSAIERRIPPHAVAMKPYLWGIIICVLVFFDNRFHVLPEKSSIKLLILTPFAALLFGSFYYVQSSGGAYLKKQHEIMGFWEKNGREIIKIVGAAIFGAIAKSVVDMLIGK